MKASETHLQPVFEGSKQYVIPLFQRHYSWKLRHWRNLWDDLLELYIADDGREHFLGAIVTMPVEMQPTGVNKYLLIDGQQRLSTLFTLLAAIRDEAKRRNFQLSDQIHEQYMVNKWSSDQNRLKLLPTQNDRDAFVDIVDGDISGHEPLTQAYRYFARMIARGDENNHSYDLSQLHHMLMQQVVIVSIVLAKDENPYLIFESLNAKGQPLTQADLVRNFLFMSIQDQDEQKIAYNDLWRPMEITLGKHITDFMWRYLTKDGTYIRQGSIYDAIKSRISKLTSVQEIVDVIVDMHTYAEYYRRLIDPETESDPEISRLLKRLNRWEINTAYPFLLALYHDFKRSRISATEMSQILSIIESFVIRRFFCRIPTNALNRLFIGIYKSIDQNDIVNSTKAHLTMRNWPSDDAFISFWKTFPIYPSGRSKTRHILESLEERLTDNNEPVDVTHSRITIEHVMPQTLNEDWEEELGENAAKIHSTLMHTIGNLTLTGKNEPMGNSKFSRKKSVFQKSNFALNKYVSEFNIWNQSTIEARALHLGQLAKTIWQSPMDYELDVDPVDPTGHKPTHITLLGTDYKVRTWREVLLTTIGVLVSKDGEEQFLTKASTVAGSSRNYVSNNSIGMAVPYQLPESDIFIETNLGSRQILSIINRILAACGHESTDFTAHW
jgi:uncharacterized protein with ParB-like and HNH nuclease domain